MTVNALLMLPKEIQIGIQFIFTPGKPEADTASSADVVPNKNIAINKYYSMVYFFSKFWIKVQN